MNMKQVFPDAEEVRIHSPFRRILRSGKQMGRLFLLGMGLVLISCVETMDLPTQADDGYQVIGQDDETYIEISPVWDETVLGFSGFSDMYCAPDGRFYLADSSRSSIHVIRASGLSETEGYEALQDIQVMGSPVKPSSVCVDSRFTVYFTDGSDRIYAWNRFLANAEVEAVVESLTVVSGAGRSMVSPYELNFLTAPFSLDLDDAVVTQDMDSIESVKESFVFYNPSSALNTQINPQYARVEKELSSLAPAAPGSEDLYIHVNDRVNDVIVRVNFIIDRLVRLSNGQHIFTFRGVFGGNAASPGTGSGTVSNVTGMTSDGSGNLFYTQLGDYFSLHKLKSGSFQSLFSLGSHEIMELDMFKAAMDVAVDDKGNIFVLDSSVNAVRKFDAEGNFLRDLAVTESWIKDSDSLRLIRTYDVLKHPTVLAVYDEIIYIGDSGNGRILRYTLADDVNIDLPVN